MAAHQVSQSVFSSAALSPDNGIVCLGCLVVVTGCLRSVVRRRRCSDVVVVGTGRCGANDVGVVGRVVVVFAGVHQGVVEPDVNVVKKVVVIIKVPHSNVFNSITIGRNLLQRSDNSFSAINFITVEEAA